MSLSLKDISVLAKEKGHSEGFVDDIVNYTEILARRELPVIFSTHHLALLIGIPVDDLLSIIKNREQFYKTYKLRKRAGGHRWIMSPEESLKYIQGWIKTNILEKTALHNAANGFRTEHSIKSNASPHNEKALILNLDLYKFFDSISEQRVYGVFKWLGYHPNLAVDLAKLLCVSASYHYWKEVETEAKFSKKYFEKRRPILPQGSPASPIISNIVAYSLDRRLYALCTRRNIEYTRYADDLTFSGTKENFPPLNILKQIIHEEGFVLNDKKIKYSTPNMRQLVTGLVVNKGVRVPSKFKKEILKELHYCRVRGVKGHLDWVEKHTDEKTKSNYKDYLLGKIFFVYSIEKQVGEKMLNQFHQVNWEI
jgi:RNA-directed DNA polymerase